MKGTDPGRGEGHRNVTDAKPYDVSIGMCSTEMLHFPGNGTKQIALTELKIVLVYLKHMMLIC